jgi:hypothetical protein
MKKGGSRAALFACLAERQYQSAFFASLRRPITAAAAAPNKSSIGGAGTSLPLLDEVVVEPPVDEEVEDEVELEVDELVDEDVEELVLEEVELDVLTLPDDEELVDELVETLPEDDELVDELVETLPEDEDVTLPEDELVEVTLPDEVDVDE